MARRRSTPGSGSGAVTVRDVLSYCDDIGWRQPPELPEKQPDSAGGSSVDADSLEGLKARLDGCDRCPLSAGRKTIVFGEGHPETEVLFIGEGPGAEEDRSGRPFVGQAGKILDGMIFALGLARRDVFITNVVKCRPPRNRDPEETEMAACSEVLERQIELLEPQIIVALGRVAARRLTGTSSTMTALRGRWSTYRGIPMISLFHPAYLLRQPLEKRATWQDLKAIRERLAGGGK